jgi:hypothetical protein
VARVKVGRNRSEQSKAASASVLPPQSRWGRFRSSRPSSCVHVAHYSFRIAAASCARWRCPVKLKRTVVDAEWTSEALEQRSLPNRDDRPLLFKRNHWGALMRAREIAAEVLSARRVVTDVLADDDDDQLIRDDGEVLAINVVVQIDDMLDRQSWSSDFPKDSLARLRALCRTLVLVLASDEKRLVNTHEIRAATAARQLLELLEVMDDSPTEEIAHAFGRLTASLCQVVPLIVSALPHEYHARYQEEFRAELCDLAVGRFSWWRQATYVVGLVSRVVQLRFALAEGAASIAAARERR